MMGRTSDTARHIRRIGSILLSLLTVLICLLQPTLARADLTLEEENKLGKELYDRLEKENLILKQDRISAYVKQLGNRILAQAGPSPFTYTFSVIRSNAVNAFATPGGYVYLNQGLITLVENEGQLASVIAHEIAHINGRHVAENIARSQKLNVATLSGILAGILLGGSTAGAAVTTFSMATAATLSLQFSRQQEESADRIGAATLVKAGYAVEDALEFMKLMRRYEYYSNSVPSYFLTHPGTEERMRYLDALIQTTYGERPKAGPSRELKRVQTLLALNGLTSDSVNLQNFRTQLNNNPEDVDALLGLAVTQDKTGMSAEAQKNFQSALRLAPDDPDLLRAYGLACFKLGRYGDADTALGRVLKGSPADPEALLTLGRSRDAQGDPNGSIPLYQRLLKSDPENEEGLYSLAMAYGKTPQTGESHYYFGLYFKKKGKFDSALFHFKAASRLFPAESARGRDIAKEIEDISRKERTEPPAPRNQKPTPR